MISWLKRNKIPARIPIRRVEHYRTHYLGRCSGNRLFWGYETFFLSKPYKDIGQNEDWRAFRREYVLLHLFNAEGRHIETKHWYGGTTNQLEAKMLSQKLDQLVAELGEVHFSDIRIEPFSVKIDGVEFGLVVNGTKERVDLEPNALLSFSEPWNGEHDTW